MKETTKKNKNSLGDKIFRTRSDWPWGPACLLYIRHRVSFLVVKRPQSNTKVKERVDLYVFSPSGTPWPILGRNLPLPLTEIYKENCRYIQGGSNMTGTNCDLFTHK
jgi:hypothetical protein